MTLQQKREELPGGGYNVVSWDDQFGHAVIWVYDADGRLQRRGMITHRGGGSPDGISEAVWHGADGQEVERHLGA